MSQVFVNAAFDRIARVVQSPVEDGEAMGAIEFVHQALERDFAARLSELESALLLDFLWFGADHYPALQFVSFAGLVEIGVQSGYVTLGEWEGTPALKEALPIFLAMEEKDNGALDLRLLGALWHRFEQPSFGSWALDDASFASFESYLHLTSRVRADDAALAFLDETHTSGKRKGGLDKDYSVLLSPRHFAEAFAKGSIAGVPVSDVAAGVTLLRYFEWFADILESLSPDSKLRADIVRHARWAHGAARVQGRFDSWVDQMREWNEGQSDASKDDEWAATAERLFGRLAAEQERVIVSGGVGQFEPEHLELEVGLKPIAEGEEVPVAERIERLVAEGRIAAARQLALAEAKVAEAYRLYRINPDAVDWLASIETLVERCLTLMELGNVDAAAAIVAPVIPALTAKYGRSGYKVVSDALAIVARARQGGPGGEEEGRMSELSARPVEPPAAREAEEKPRYQALGESS